MSNTTGGRVKRAPRDTIWLSVALVALTLTVFAPVRHFSFVSWDDPLYVSENPVVRQGLTLHGMAWALTAAGRFYWHPLTWMSHMADVQMFGMQPGAHHVTSLLLHAAGTLLLFWVLHRLTGQAGRSAVVAALFAVHPLRVESVAWIAERKDVLSGVFWMLTIWAYHEYVRSPGRSRYAAVAGAFVLGLMSKPTLVTLPLVLLLLDFWPLDRMRAARDATHARRSHEPATATGVWRLVMEKIPLFALAIGASLVTFLTQYQVGAVQGLETLPVRERLFNAVASTVSYIGMAAWPTGLAAFYPFRPIHESRVLWSLLILAGVSYAAIRLRARRPYLLVGWLWYLVTLVPVIGLIQVGSQAMADRFTYLPLVGLLIALAWGAADMLAALRARRLVAGALAVAAIAACAVAARAQVGYWKDSETLWRRAVDVVRDNDVAHANLGLVLAAEGRTDDAAAHLAEALRIVEAPAGRAAAGRGTPPAEYAAVLHDQFGRVLRRQGRWKEAAAHFRVVSSLRPDSADAHYALAQVLASDSQFDEAAGHYREAIRLDAGRAEFYGDFASLLYSAGDLGGAMAQLEAALRLNPTHPSAAKWHYNRAAMLNESGRAAEAISELEAALAIDPTYEQARRALMQLRKPPR